MTRHMLKNKGPGGRGRGRRGSILILAVVVLVIIALLGLAYIQQAKMDRYATERYGRGYMDIVLNGILADLNKQLKDDVVENQDRALYDYPWTDPTPTTGTNPGEVAAYTYDGTQVNVSGDIQDDHYLASTAPIITGPNPDDYVWPHITNLTGIWLQLPALGSGNDQPVETEIDYSGATAEHTDAWAAGGTTNAWDLGVQPAGYQVNGVDTDGDGIFDSRWQYAPISVRDLGGRKYVMALRMIDLNALINVNAATPLQTFAEAGNNTAAMSAIAAGYSPADVNLSRLLARIDNLDSDYEYAGSTQFANELQALLNFRNMQAIAPLVTPGPLTVPTPLPERFNMFASPATGLWPQQVSLYGNTDRNFLGGDELELRFGGGLNNPLTLTALEATMPRLTRNQGTPAAEGQWSNVAPETGPATVGNWFYGMTTATPSHDEPIEDRVFAGVRHMLTTASGTAMYGQYISVAPAAPKPSSVRYDLGQGADFTDIHKQVEAAFKSPIGTPGSWYRNLNVPLIDQVIDEYVLAITDYIDGDSDPGSHLSDDGVTMYYGMERLPFLREVYIQGGYTEDGADANPLTWAKVDDSMGMAVEIGNPFDRPIELEGADAPRVRLVAWQGATQPATPPLVINFADLDTNQLEPADPSSADPKREQLILYWNPNTEVNGQGGDLPSDLNFDTTTSEEVSDVDPLPLDINGEQVWVALQVMPEGGTAWVTYDRLSSFTGAEMSLPSTVTLTTTPTAVLSGNVQRTLRRAGEGVSYLSNFGVAVESRAPSAANATWPDDDGNGTADDFDSGVDYLENDNKGVAPDPQLYDTGGNVALFQVPIADRPMLSIGELGWVLMFGFTSAEDFPQRLTAMNVDRWFLDIRNDPNAQVADGGGTGLPHAAMLMDMFTTVGSHDDGVDNDNDDGDNDPAGATANIDNPAEMLVPGTINVNTATLPVLTLAAPLGGETIQETASLMRTIISYRDVPRRALGFTPTGLNGDWDGRTPYDDSTLRDNGVTRQRRTPASAGGVSIPGIASLGELLFLNPQFANTGTTGPFDMQVLGLSGGADSVGPTPEPWDLYPTPGTTDAEHLAVANDPEERLSRFQALTQVFTVRSDRFAVYGVVRGYLDNGFNQTPLEEARFIAIIDRGGLKPNGTGTPRVIAFQRLE